MCSVHQKPTNQICCQTENGSPDILQYCNNVICTSCIADREDALKMFPDLRKCSHVLCESHFNSLVKLKIKSPREPRIKMLPDGKLNPVAEALFPMFVGGGDGGGVGVVVVAPGSCKTSATEPGLHLVTIVKCEMVTNAINALLAAGSQAPTPRSASGSAPRHNGQINNAFCKGYIGLVIWKLMVDSVDGNVPWVKPSSFKLKERQEKFEALLSSLFHVYDKEIKNVITHLAINSFVVTYSGLNQFCNNLKRKRYKGLWANLSKYHATKLYAHHCKLLIQLGYTFES